MNVINVGRSLTMAHVLMSRNICWRNGVMDKINVKGIFSQCLMSTAEFILWVQAINVMGIEVLLANAQTLLGTKELIVNMKPMNRMTGRRRSLQARLQPGLK